MAASITLLEKRVLYLIRCQGLLSKGDRVVVAVSGGADSVSLLYILHKYKEEIGINLHIAHLDHGLRYEESDVDARFVRNLADKLNLPSTIEKRDVQGYRKEYRLTLEEAAREVRYQFLSEVAENIGAVSVAVAHTKSDHVETVLLHLLRGSGLSGLVGLKEAVTLRYKRIEHLKIIRPLICLTRAEVETYCFELGIDYRTDATNESLTPTRNRIRLKLLPEIRRDFNPRIDEGLDRLSRLAADDLDFVVTEAERAKNKITRLEAEVLVIEKAMFLELHPALRRAVMRQVLTQALGSPKDIEAVHIERMLDLAKGNAGQAIDLPDGLVFSAGYKELLLGRDLSKVTPLPPLDGEYRLNIPGVTELSDWRVTAEIIEAVGSVPVEQQETDTMVELMAYDKTGDELSVRARRLGDRFRPLGMSEEKKLKDFFIDAKVPQLWRSRVPIVVNPRHIVWITGYRLDDRVKVTAATQRTLRLEFTPV